MQTKASIRKMARKALSAIKAGNAAQAEEDIVAFIESTNEENEDSDVYSCISLFEDAVVSLSDGNTVGAIESLEFILSEI